VLDPDLEIRWGGASHPEDKRGVEGLVSPKKFSALRASVWSKIRGVRWGGGA